MGKIQIGDMVYYVANGMRVQEALVVDISGHLYSLRFRNATTNAPSGVRLRESRLFTSREEAEKTIVPDAVKKPAGPPHNAQIL